MHRGEQWSGLSVVTLRALPRCSLCAAVLAPCSALCRPLRSLPVAAPERRSSEVGAEYTGALDLPADGDACAFGTCSQHLCKASSEESRLQPAAALSLRSVDFASVRNSPLILSAASLAHSASIFHPSRPATSLLRPLHRVHSACSRGSTPRRLFLFCSAAPGLVGAQTSAFALALPPPDTALESLATHTSFSALVVSDLACRHSRERSLDEFQTQIQAVPRQRSGRCSRIISRSSLQ